MVEGFAPHVGSEEPLCNLGMAQGSAALLLFAFGLRGTEGRFRTTFVRLYSLFRTYDGIPLQHRGTSVKYEDWLDSIEEEFAYPAEEAQNVCIDQGLALPVTHGGLKLVDPNAGVNGKGPSLHGFQPFRVFSVHPHI
jgi:hypothetical protein